MVQAHCSVLLLCYSSLVTQLKILTWNLGFGAMGANAEVSFEGGRHLIPSSGGDICRNIIGIQNTLTDSQADVYLLQELSSGSILNRWHNIRRAIHNALPEHSRSSVSNFSLPLYFDFLRNEHGMGTYVKKPLTIDRRHTKLFKNSDRYYRIFPRLDFALTSTVKVKGKKALALVNTHLSSFDTYGAMRISQFLELMEYVKKLSKHGYAVVIGADWNMNSGKYNFVGEDENQYHSQIHDFPTHLLPHGWTTHFTHDVPTVRAGNRPYTNGKSTTATIDGFICSPEIQVENIKTFDLQFEHSDHNPVEMIISY